MSESQEYSIRWRGRQFGPYTIQEINRKLDEHEIGMGHEIHYQNRWISVEEFLLSLKSAAAGSGVMARPSLSQSTEGAGQRAVRLVASEPTDAALASTEGAMPRRSMPPLQPSSRQQASTLQDEAAGGSELSSARPRNRIIYVIFALLLGFLGVHNFYARHWLTGLFQLILSLTTFLLGFGIIATWMWALVEAVLIRKDGYGTEMG